jgi:hypothetical protein
MHRIVLALAAVLISNHGALAQPVSHLYTRPTLPPAEALERLGLKTAWYAKVPMESMRDGIASIQLLPGEAGDEILIQTKSGMVQLLDAENGDLRWRTSIGKPYQALQNPAFNSHSIYVTRGTRLFVLNRNTGKHRLFVVEKTGVIVLGVPILNAPSAPLLADEAAIFVASDKRLTGYLLPKSSKLQVTLPTPKPGEILKSKDLASTPEPKLIGTYILNESGITRPVITFSEALGIYTDSGILVSVNKFNLKERYHFKTYGIASADLGQHGKMAYCGSSDHNVYAFNLISGKLRWRFLAGSAVTRTPFATDADVFVRSEALGLCRVDREDGRLVWKNPKADLFMAVNNKYVYALDAHRSLLVLDYLKGTTLSSYDFRDFVVPYSNTLSDRIYFGNHDGALLCLRHQSLAKPYRPTTWEE